MSQTKCDQGHASQHSLEWRAVVSGEVSASESAEEMVVSREAELVLVPVELAVALEALAVALEAAQEPVAKTVATEEGRFQSLSSPPPPRTGSNQSAS